ncbi:MAG: hypothetical protein VKO21_07180 [Candidatus Sericytochromatia bacterium]|nr:hypothetical protein [Candidatus Sericytochromatia bacterium]
MDADTQAAAVTDSSRWQELAALLADPPSGTGPWLSCLTRGLSRPVEILGTCPDASDSAGSSDGLLVTRILPDGASLVVRGDAKAPLLPEDEAFLRCVVAAMSRMTLAPPPASWGMTRLWQYGGRLLARGQSGAMALTPLLVLTGELLGTCEIALLESDAEQGLQLAARTPTSPDLGTRTRWPQDELAWLPSFMGEGRMVLEEGSGFEQLLPGLFVQEDPCHVVRVPLGRREGPAGLLVLRWAVPEHFTPALTANIKEIAGLFGILTSQRAVLQDLQATRAVARVSQEQARRREAFVRQILHDLRNQVHALALTSDDLASHEPRPHREEALASISRQIGCLSGYLWDIGRTWDHNLAKVVEQETPIAEILEEARASWSDAHFDDLGISLRMIVSCSRDSCRELIAALHEATTACSGIEGVRYSFVQSRGWLTIVAEALAPLAPSELGLVRIPPSHLGLAAVAAVRQLEELAASMGTPLGIRLYPGHPPRLHIALRTSGWGETFPDQEN